MEPYPNDPNEVAVTDLLPRADMIALWKQFKKRHPDKFGKMLEYDGSDPDLVQAMRRWVTTFIHGKMDRGEIPVKEWDLRSLEATAIGGSVVQLAKAMHPDIVFRRVDPY